MSRTTTPSAPDAYLLLDICCGPGSEPRALTPAEARRVHVLHLRKDSLLKRIAFLDGKIALAWRNLLNL